MPVLAIDLGGTKLATAVFSEDGRMLSEEQVLLDKREGAAVAALLIQQVIKTIAGYDTKGIRLSSIGISVPGICYQDSGAVWVPNIPGWENYSLRDEVEKAVPNIAVSIDNDRACYILGEYWQGVAKDCTDAIFIAVGTGIGAGILSNGNILRGANDIAGAAGWMALERPYDNSYTGCGCFETNASGDGIAKLARKLLQQQIGYNGSLRDQQPGDIKAHDIFKAYDAGDAIATETFKQCVELWGMAVANFISLFNPQKIILGGGVFGPAVPFIPAIRSEAAKWAQPISMQKVSIEASALGCHAGLYGAALLALRNTAKHKVS